MEEAGLDWLVAQSANQYLTGYVRYLLDQPPGNYPATVLLPRTGDLVLIQHGGGGEVAPSPLDRGVGRKFALPFIGTLGYTGALAADKAAEVLREDGARRVGIVGMGFLPAAFYRRLQEALPGVDLVDAGDVVDRVKARKSPEEVERIRRAVLLHDFLAEAMPTILRPGRTETEVRAEIAAHLIALGSEEQWIMMGSAPPGAPTPHQPPFLQGRRIEAGDQVFVMIEASGPGGYFAEIGRTWVLGPVPEALKRAWEAARCAQEAAAERLRPGVPVAEVVAASDAVLQRFGFPPERRLMGHSQGYDIVERPAVLAGESLVLEEGMYLALHPAASGREAYAFCCDNFLITREGAGRLQRTPQAVFQLV
jgi:Xaa-Pro aminopeptidase